MGLIRADSVPQPPRRRSTLFLAGSLAGGNVIAMVLRLAGGILLARLVDPSTLGLFNGIGLVLGYSVILQLGVLSGLNRELPFFVGKGDTGKVKELASAAQAFALAMGGLVFIGLCGVAVWELLHGETMRAAGWFTNAILAVFYFYSTQYLENTFRTSHDFVRLAGVHVVEGASTLILLFLVALFGFYGLCLRSILATIVVAALLFYWRPVRVGPRWIFRHIKHLTVIGAPILFVGLLYGWWGGVINSTLVLKLTGTEGMGLYSMVVTAGMALEIIPLAVSQVVYPRMAEQYGRTSRLTDIIRVGTKPTILTTVALVPVAALAWFAVGPLTRLIVPNYAAAVPAMQWALLLPLVSSLQTMCSVFNVARRQDLYTMAIAIGMAAYGTSLVLLVRDGAYLAAFPQAMLIGRAAYMAASFVFIVRLRRRERRSDLTAAQSSPAAPTNVGLDEAAGGGETAAPGENAREPRPEPKVAIVVLNYKNYDDTIQCLRSLLETDYREREIVVVDNDSQNDSLAHIAGYLEAEAGISPVRIDEDAPESARERAGRVFTVQSAENRGYAAGNNLGIRVALAREADYVLIINNDTVVEPGFLAPLVEHLETYAKVAAAGPLLLEPGGRVEPYTARRRPLPGDFFFVQGAGHKLFPHNHWLRSLSYEGARDLDRPLDVDVLSGSCMLVRSSVFRDVGLLDEGTFLFEEEFIFHERLRAVGLVSTIVPASRVVHKHSRSTSRTPAKRLQAIQKQSQRYYWTRYRRYNRIIVELLVLSGHIPTGVSARLRRRKGA